MVLDDGIFVANYIFMVEAFEYVDLFFDGSDMLFADVYFLHGDEDPVVEVDTFKDLSIGSFADFLNQLVALDCL